MTKNNHEILICGAGMIGLTFALLMAKKRINVCIIDKNSKKSLFEQKDTRTTAVSQGSHRIYKEIEIWNKIRHKVQPINQILVSEGSGSSDIEFDHRSLQEGPLGFIIENKIIKQELLKKVLSSKYITFREKTEVHEIENKNINCSFVKTNRKIFNFRLLVAADGRFSKTRYQADIKYLFHDYEQKAYVFNISHQEKHRSIALERFFSTGPMALLPMQCSNEKKSSVVWTVDSNVSSKLAFKKNFNKEFGQRYNNFFGKFKIISDIKNYPLNLYSCYDSFNQNVILIGDACQAIHPIAGQGFNLGLRDAKCLADIVHKYSTLGLQLYNDDFFKMYENKRRIDKNLLIFSTHNLNKLFSGSNNFKAVFRKLGLKIFSKSNFLKRQSMLFAMGLRNN